MTDLIEIPTPDGPMPAFSATPAQKPLGAVIVIQEAFGLTEHIGSMTERMAEAGFRAIAPALFHRSGGSPTAAYDDIPSVYPLMQSITAETITADVDATVELLASEGFAESQIGMVGFCMGGSVTLASATRAGIGAAVTYYGGGLAEGRFGWPPLLEMGTQLRCPWIGHFGDLDKGIPVEQVEELRSAVAAAPVAATIYRYAEADHGFNCEDRPSVFNADAAAEAWERTVAFFRSTLGR